MWCDNLPRLQGKLSQVIFPYKVFINNHRIRSKEIRYCSIVARGSLKTLAYHSLPKYWMQKTKNLKQNVWQLAPVYPTHCKYFINAFSTFSNYFSSCEFKWVPGPWEGCTATCGNEGIQYRQIYCLHASFDDNEVTKQNEVSVYSIMVQPIRCKDDRPPENKQDCNRTPCPGNWIFTDWSKVTKDYAYKVLHAIYIIF